VDYDNFGFRKIETVEDAETALTYPKLSFEQCIECIQVLREAGKWRLHHLAAERAVQEGFGVNRSFPRRKVRQAALEVLDAYLEQAPGLDELRGCLERGVSWLEQLSEVEGFDPTTGEFFKIEIARKDFNQLQLLIYRSTLACFVPMAGLLRKFGPGGQRMAVVAATKKLDDDPDDVAALTVRGAAHTDLGNLRDATRDHERGFELKPDDAYLLTAFSRTRQEDGRRVDALELAKRAVEIEPSEAHALRLVAAARAMHNEAEANKALQILESRPGEAPSPGVEQMCVALAALVVEQIRLPGWRNKVEEYLRAVSNEEIILDETRKIIKDLKAAVKEDRDRDQGRFDL